MLIWRYVDLMTALLMQLYFKKSKHLSIRNFKVNDLNSK